MKTAFQTVTAFMGILCLIALAGCPKKAVVTAQTPDPTPKPVVEDEGAGFRWNLVTIHFDFDLTSF